MPAGVEVLIVSYDSADALAGCLASLRGTAPELPIAVREHSPHPAAGDRLRRCLADHPGPVRLEFDPSNPGFGAGCNALAAGSDASWLVFLNPDAELLSWPWTHDSPPIRAVVGARIVDSGPDGTHAGVSYRLIDEIGRSWVRRRPQPRHGRGFVSGAAMLIDAESFRRLGGFDQRYFLFYEDIDLCLRANGIGVPTVVEADWVVRHAGGHSTRSRFGSSLVWSYESGCLFHGSRGTPVWLYRTYVVADAGARSILHAIRHHRSEARAYGALARRAFTDIVRGRRRTAADGGSEG